VQTLALLIVSAAGLWLVAVAVLMAVRPVYSLHLYDRMLANLEAGSHRQNLIEQGLRLLAGAALIVRSPASKLPMPFEIFGWLLVFALCTLGEVVFTASPGKWLLGFVIGTASAARAPMWRLLLRWCAKYAPVPLVAAGVAVLESGSLFRATFGVSASPALWSIARVLGLVAGVWAWCIALGAFLALLPARRTLHDWIAGTAVFQDGRLEGAPAQSNRGFEVTPVLSTEPAPSPSDSPS